jgi:hypothetical protein
MLTNFFKKFKNFFLKKDSLFWDFLFFILLLFFFFRYWKKQLNISYIDYGDGCLLYEASLFKNGLIIYKDFFAPQPPIIYLFGSLILKIFNNPLSIRYFLFVLFLVSDVITFYIIFKFLKNKIISLLTIICSHIFFATIYWWPTFTGETFLRFLLVLFLFYFLPVEKNIKKKLFITSFLLNLIIFTKFTAVFFIVFTFLFLLIIDKRLFFSFIKYFVILFLIFFGFFLFIFGKDFLYQTIFIRKILPIKSLSFSIPSATFFLIKFLSFYLLNFVLAIIFFKKKQYSQSFLFFISCFWFPSIIFNFFEGTYLYIFYPVELFLPLGFSFLIFNFKKIKFTIFSKLVILISFFWSILVLIYQLQVLESNYFLASNYLDQMTTQKILEIIKDKTKKNETIIAPPFFAFFSHQPLIDNFHDPFIFYYYLLSKNRYFFFEKALNLIKKKKPKLIIADWRIKKVLSLIDKNYFLEYKKNNSFYFLNNEDEILEIYIKNH